MGRSEKLKHFFFWAKWRGIFRIGSLRWVIYVPAGTIEEPCVLGLICERINSWKIPNFWLYGGKKEAFRGCWKLCSYNPQ